MKITIEFESLAELDAFRGAAPATETPAAAPAEPKKRATRRTKKQIEAEKAAAQTPAEPEPAAQPSEPPPSTEPAAPAEASPPAEGAAGDVDFVKQRFKDLVGEDYEAALSIVENLGCGTFDEIVEQGKLPALVAAMDDVAV